MTWDDIFDLTPSRLQIELGGDETKPAIDLVEVANRKRGESIRRLCAEQRTSPEKLMRKSDEELARWVKRVTGHTTPAAQVREALKAAVTAQ